MLRNFIGFDRRVNDQGEGDPPYFWQVPVDDSRYLRLLPIDELSQLSGAQKSEIVLIKPLHDSQRASELLRSFPRSKGFWIFRHYQDVILSHLTYYKERYDPFLYLRDLLDLRDGSWMVDGLGLEMSDFIREHRHLATTPTAGFALFWLARNSLYFKQTDPDLIVLNYAGLVADPARALEVIGDHIGLSLDQRYADLPRLRLRSVALPDEIPLPIKLRCELMMADLLGQAAV